MWNLFKKIIKINKKSSLYKLTFRSKECSCIFKIKKLLDPSTINLRMIKTCEEHEHLLNEKNLKIDITSLEQGIEKKEFILDTINYMKLNKEKDKK